MKRLGERFPGLYWRQMLLTMGTVLLTLALLGASYSALGYNFLRQERINDMETRAGVVARLSTGYLSSGGFSSEEELLTLAGFAASISDLNFLVCDTQGRALLSTDAGLDGLSVTIPRNLMDKTLTQGVSSGRSNLGGVYTEKHLVVGVPVADAAGKPVGAVFVVSVLHSALDKMWQGFIGLFVMTSCVVLMVAFMASSVTAMRQVRPIREMVVATRRFADGEFDIRMRDTERNDEIGELAVSFNNMAETLLQTERKRREFVANISHELKTPMTTIAGYTDGILDGTIPYESEKQYLQIIAEESRRLSRMVRRMLDVSQLQAIDPMKNGAHFDLCESMRRVLISMEKKITDRGLDVDADIPEEPILVLGDNDMITQVIYNLLENAAKFATPGSVLYLGVARRDGKARVVVRNEGDTIPPEELPLLFERFHKSDKSRSEDKTGVGLGLYIVKTILEQHREKINVTSENGVTEFSFSLTAE
ncbi:HAMP domain-containing sensor histidine kinase [Oscillibacter sp.]|uniref:sensor histidine kinase n=1 Tax=Oscillibacter sp. TaxID=1945593 RepID=UPI00289E5C7E|nr:HAMP domain-containing sensor histidine kinase [Oscillibacter sp.]